jgi:hypothetical protein
MKPTHFCQHFMQNFYRGKRAIDGGGNAERVTDLHVADGSEGREFKSRGRRFFLWQKINPRMEL